MVQVLANLLRPKKNFKFKKKETNGSEFMPVNYFYSVFDTFSYTWMSILLFFLCRVKQLNDYVVYLEKKQNGEQANSKLTFMM